MTVTGFIGLGSQGGPMARRIVESGYPLLLWARRAETLVPFEGTAARSVASVAELGARADHVGVCVVDDAGTRQVCGELIPAMRPGSRIAIHSTVHPQTVVELGAQAATRQISLLDAPVSGGGPAAASRTLTVMIGGAEEVVAAARPIFETFGGLIVRVGDVGAGQMAKLVNNALMAAHMAMAHHGLAAAATLGLDRAALTEIIKASSGRSYGFEVYSRLPTPGAFDHGAKLLAKDVRLLGEVLGADSAYAPFRDVVAPFLQFVQRPQP
jgi:3-hydroxyisobutyrate dehydrogenase-like beta-hydroxyacid dehydrogenase